MTYSRRVQFGIAAIGLCSLARPVAAQTAPPVAPQGAIPQGAIPQAAAPTSPVSAPAPAAGPQSAYVQAAPGTPTAAPPASVMLQQPLPPPGYVLVPAGSVYPTAPTPASPGTLAPGMELPYTEGQPIPQGYRLVEQMRKGLVIAGSLTLGVPWVFSATGAVGNDFEDKSGFLMIPAIGPFLMLATGGAKNRDCTGDYSSSLDNCNRSDLRALLFLDGVTQTAGAIMLAFGATVPRKRLVRDEVVVSFAPTSLGRDGYGLGAVGTF